jgi:hypothetical protein
LLDLGGSNRDISLLDHKHTKRIMGFEEEFNEGLSDKECPTQVEKLIKLSTYFAKFVDDTVIYGDDKLAKRSQM